MYLVNFNSFDTGAIDKIVGDRYGGSKVVTHDRWTFLCGELFRTDFRSCEAVFLYSLLVYLSHELRFSISTVQVAGDVGGTADVKLAVVLTFHGSH